ncbi:MAG: hypothetical protein RBU30_21930 [Polyangia bacterium]|jgi:hypothetical protein|nr:hypothetical protein [Polyangia bacterium]
MIAYEDLCLALDRYNRRLRGEVVPEPSQAQGMEAEELDFVEEQPAAAPPPPPRAFGVSQGSSVPDVTLETALPEGSYGQGQYGQQGYGSGSYPQQQQPAPGSGPVGQTPYPGSQDPYR